MKNVNVATIVAPAVIDPAIGPLTLEHRQEYTLARKRAKSIYKAAAVAAFNAWATAVAAVLSLPFALVSMFGFVTTAALCFVAGIEFRGRKRLLQFDPSAAAILGWNQLTLLALIVGYCGWSIYTSFYGANSVTAQLQAFSEIEPALNGSSAGVEILVQRVVVVLYGSVIVLSIVVQGLSALYYFTRRRYIDAYLTETPAWIRELQRSTHSP